MADFSTQGVNLQVGDAASPEVFTTVADVTSLGDLGVTRSSLDTTKLNSNVRTSKAGLPSVSDLTVEGTYDGNNTTVAGFWTNVTTEDQTDRNWKLDLDISPAEVWSFTGHVSEFMVVSGSPDSLIKFRMTLRINTVPTLAAT